MIDEVYYKTEPDNNIKSNEPIAFKPKQSHPHFSCIENRGTKIYSQFGSIGLGVHLKTFSLLIKPLKDNN